YRLKNPTRALAKEIITQTAASVRRAGGSVVECGVGLEPLLDDLLRLRPPASGLAASTRSTASRVPMPFLQIVCHSLWNRESPALQTAGDARFLDSYEAGEASGALTGYVQAKLEPKKADGDESGLTSAELDLISSAFGFLMTRSGAKMAYPADLLAEQI